MRNEVSDINTMSSGRTSAHVVVTSVVMISVRVLVFGRPVAGSFAVAFISRAYFYHEIKWRERAAAEIRHKENEHERIIQFPPFLEEIFNSPHQFSLFIPPPLPLPPPPPL